MNLQMSASIADTYTSNSQKIIVITENCVNGNFRHRCGNDYIN